MRMSMHDIKWKCLYDKNSDKEYVSAQLLLQCTHELKYNERNEGQMPELRRSQDSARYVLEEQLKK